jgi:hypothetical protein
MRNLKRGLMLSGCLGLLVGCTTVKTPNTFTFVPDFPPGFKYDLTATYVPAKGQTCTVPGGRNTQLGYNKTNMKYEGTSEIPLYRTVSECPLALNYIEIKVIGIYGSGRSNFSYDYASIAVRPELLERQMGTFREDGEGEILGQCMWFFRTVSPKRNLIKMLRCKGMDQEGNVAQSRPHGAYTLDQLPGKTVRLKTNLANEEQPGWGDTWVQVPGGWKRCMGEGYEDQRGYCNGNYEDFSTFRMVDGRICTIYPSCNENTDETP